MRNSILICLLTLCYSAGMAQNHRLTRLWETDTVLKVPESVLFDESRQVLYVSNIDGQPGERDGKGSIGKVDLNGKIINGDWVPGLNAPKGMALYHKTLWVSDLDEVVAIDVESGRILERVKIDGAQFLNDVTIDKNAVVYVSDSRTGKVHKIFGGKAEVFLENLKGPNGLLALDDNLYLLDNGVFYEVELDDKEMKKIADGIEGGSDGIERVEGKEFIVSSWSGVVYYVDDDGNKEKLLDTREQKINSADIGYDARNRVVYVPTFWKKSIVAYRLE